MLTCVYCSQPKDSGLAACTLRAHANPSVQHAASSSGSIQRLSAAAPVDGDVAPVADLLGQVRCVEDELGLEERVLPVLRQEAQVQRQVEVRHGLVQEARVARLVPRHQREDLRRQRRSQNHWASDENQGLGLLPPRGTRPRGCTPTRLRSGRSTRSLAQALQRSTMSRGGSHTGDQ